MRLIKKKNAQATPIVSNNHRRNTIFLNKKTLPKSFLVRAEAQHIFCMVLAQAKREGYKNSVAFGRHIGWLKCGEMSFSKLAVY